jgi:DNA (cytosine-5)-methyltransferase 1
VQSDVRNIDINKLRTELGIEETDQVLYAACTPCQPFSTLNKLKGEDERKYLLLAFAELVKKCPPDFILVENVPGLNNAYGKLVYEKFIAALAEAGFSEENMDSALLDANDFGVPQVRKRFILVASRHGTIKLPKPIKSQNPTVRDLLEKYPPLKNGEESHEILNHISRKLQPHHLKIVKAVPKDGGSRKDVADTSILLKCHQDNPNVHKDVFGRMAWDSPSPTLTCRCTDVYCGRFIHPEQDRGISLREAAALQTFPDSYEFFGTFQQIAKQIGNAVPVKLAEHLGIAIKNVAE